MKIRTKPGYSFDDVLLIPQHSKVISRSKVKLDMELGRMQLALPILASNMDTVCEAEMAIAMYESGGAGVLHRFADLETQRKWVQELHEAGAWKIVSVGVEFDIEFLKELHHDFGLHAICVDVAHGDHEKVVVAVSKLSKNITSPRLDIIAGNVATGKAALYLAHSGATIIKVGIGPGSVCSTRVVTGHGVPQLSAIEDVHQTLLIEGLRKGLHRTCIIADGGIRYPGDIVKALAAGADAVMLGSLLAGTDEAAGERIVEDGIAYKTFRGMASLDVQKQKRAGTTPRVEGVSARVPYRGPVRDTLANLEAGIRSGLSYSGANDISELRNAAEFVVVTGNTLKENHPHHPYKL